MGQTVDTILVTKLGWESWPSQLPLLIQYPGEWMHVGLATRRHLERQA